MPRTLLIASSFKLPQVSEQRKNQSRSQLYKPRPHLSVGGLESGPPKNNIIRAGDLRRTNTMANDTATTRLLYAILSQKCLKDVRPLPL